MKTLKQLSMNEINYKEKLKQKMDEYVHLIFKVTKSYPKDELYGTTSQIRRSTLSIILNYIEGYARRKPLVQLNFFEISYGSLKESKYLLGFCYNQGYLNKEDFDKGLSFADEIGAMLWTEIMSLENKYKK